jgi:hypothetical protein
MRSVQKDRPFLLYFESSTAFCNPLNIVQDVYGNRHAGEREHDAEALADCFERGERLYPDGLFGFKPESCHQEAKVVIRSPVNRTTLSTPSEPLISVCIPTYNRSTMLLDAVFSVLNQGYQCFEIVVVDDGSTDRTEEVLRSITDQRIRYVKQNRGGRAVARNRCVSESNGDFVLWLDSDDALCEDVLSVYIKAIRRYPDSDIFYGNLISTDKFFNFIRNDTYDDWYRKPNAFLSAMVFKNVLPNPGTLVRKSLFKTIGLFNKEFYRAQDYEWFSRIPGNGEVKHIEINVCKWRHHNHGRATNGRGQEYDCRIVDSLILRHSLQAICSPFGWGHLPDNVTEALTSIKIAERYISLNSPRRALPWLRRARAAKAGHEVTRLAIRVLDSLSKISGSQAASGAS